MEAPRTAARTEVRTGGDVHADADAWLSLAAAVVSVHRGPPTPTGAAAAAAGSSGVRRWSLCLDIDGTMLLHRDFVPNERLLALASLARRSGMEVFAVTARMEGASDRAWTLGQIRAFGVDSAHLLMHDCAAGIDSGACKVRHRRDLARAGMPCLLMVGDQPFDFYPAQRGGAWGQWQENMPPEQWAFGAFGVATVFSLRLPSNRTLTGAATARVVPRGLDYYDAEHTLERVAETLRAPQVGYLADIIERALKLLAFFPWDASVASWAVVVLEAQPGQADLDFPALARALDTIRLPILHVTGDARLPMGPALGGGGGGGVALLLDMRRRRGGGGGGGGNRGGFTAEARASLTFPTTGRLARFHESMRVQVH
jgi:hypothetical protein